MELNHLAPFAASRQGRGGEELRALDWQGLCARLAAAHDLRRALAAPAGEVAQAGASFAARVARALAASGLSAWSVNLEPLADGKARSAMPEATGDRGPAPQRDRGQQ